VAVLPVAESAFFYAAAQKKEGANPKFVLPWKAYHSPERKQQTRGTRPGGRVPSQAVASFPVKRGSFPGKRLDCDERKNYVKTRIFEQPQAGTPGGVYTVLRFGVKILSWFFGGRRRINTSK
jgi:hypothetical protein